jgi:4-aminobutyrate aminotransferase-like enzyme
MIAVDLTGAIADRVKEECAARGLLIATVGDQMLRLLPPMVLTEQEADRGLELLELAMAAAAQA